MKHSVLIRRLVASPTIEISIVGTAITLQQFCEIRSCSWCQSATDSKTIYFYSTLTPSFAPDYMARRHLLRLYDSHVALRLK